MSAGTKMPSAFNMNVFEAMDYTRAVYVEPVAAAKTAAALQGLQTIIALLHQREMDAEAGNEDVGLTFTHNVVMGLLCAAATCAHSVEEVLEGNSLKSHVFERSGPGERVMHEAIDKAKQADAQQFKNGGAA